MTIPVSAFTQIISPQLQQDTIDNQSVGLPYRFSDFAVGRRSNIGNTIVDLWEGPTATYVFPTTAIQMQVVSSSASDAAAGTGVQKVIIHYLDNAYAAKNEVVTLNGLTPVNTVATNILRVNGMHATAVGSGGVSAGNISLQSVGGGVTYGYMSTGVNTARQAIYTVPAGYDGYISHWQQSSGSAGSHYSQVSIRATSHNGILYPGVFLVVDEHGSQNGGDAYTLPVPRYIPATADVKMSAISDALNAGVTVNGTVIGWLEIRQS